eukprot:3552025-Amphidinium_carterae.1
MKRYSLARRLVRMPPSKQHVLGTCSARGSPDALRGLKHLEIANLLEASASAHRIGQHLGVAASAFDLSILPGYHPPLKEVCLQFHEVLTWCGACAASGFSSYEARLHGQQGREVLGHRFPQYLMSLSSAPRLENHPCPD